MKKTLSILLVVALTAMLAVSCATNAEVEPQAVGQVVILNNALPLLDTSVQVYNAKETIPCWSIADVVENSFVFQPADDTLVVCCQVDDYGYSDTITWGGDPNASRVNLQFGFKERQYAVYGQEGDSEELFVGAGSNYTYRAYYTNISVIGNEVLLMMQKDNFDEIAMSSIVETIRNNTLATTAQTVVDADAWTFVDVDGNELLLTKTEFENAVLYPEGKGANVVSGSKFLKNVRCFYAADRDLSKVAADGKTVYRFTVLANAEGIYGVDAPMMSNFQGTAYPNKDTIKGNKALAGSFSMEDLLAAYDVEPVEAVTVMSYLDGYSRDEAWDLFTAKYAGWHKSRELITLGAAQAKADDSIWNIGYFIAGPSVFAYIPEDGLTLADAVALTNTTPAYAVLTYLDGTTITFDAEQIDNAVIANGSQLLKVELF